MKSKPMRKLLKYTIFLILFVAIFMFQACGPTPAEAITDANKNIINITSTKTYKSSEPVLGNAGLLISNITANSIHISFGDGAPTEVLSNYGGGEQNGNYLYQNGTKMVAINLSDASAVTVMISSINSDIQFSMDPVLCE